MKELLNDEKFVMKVLYATIIACVIATLVIVSVIFKQNNSARIIIDWNSPQFIGSRSGQYSAIFAKNKLTEELSEQTLKEFEEEKEVFAIAHSNAELIRLYGISFKENSISDLAVDCNTKLFEICNKYFLTTYQGQQLSPLIPMTISNIETPHRATQAVTYSALFPSKIIPITSADAISNMSCLAVMESPEVFAQLAADHWTRDRGALQMNPAYGVDYPAFNSLMGPSEAEILGNIRGTGIDLSLYNAYEPRNSRTITGDMWLDELSTYPGDRFSVKDSVLRLASACQSSIDQYGSQYQIENDMETMCLLAMSHNSGSVWNPAYQQSKVGNWRNGATAYTYCKQITSPEFTVKLKNYCTDKLESARNSSKEIPMTLDRKDAKALFEEAEAEGIVSNYISYVYEGNYYEVTYCYPIQALYAYTMLGLVYSGK